MSQKYNHETDYNNRYEIALKDFKNYLDMGKPPGVASAMAAEDNRLDPSKFRGFLARLSAAARKAKKERELEEARKQKPKIVQPQEQLPAPKKPQQLNLFGEKDIMRIVQKYSETKY